MHTPKRNWNRANERVRQARLRERRKSEGWRRVSVWLTPGEAATLEHLGDEWLGRTVKALLCESIHCDLRTGQGQPLKLTPAVIPDPETFALEVSTTVSGNVTDGAEDWIADADTLLAQGLSPVDIAARFNEQGRRTAKGAEFRGSNIMRALRKWKAV